MSKGDVQQKKVDYASKLVRLIDEYPTIILVIADNVGSQQMHQVRISVRKDSVILMGKNTLIRKIMRTQISKHHALESLMPHIRGNVGLVFTKGDPAATADLLLKNRVPAAAKAGIIAPCEVFVPAGGTGMGPEKTSFFQALGIATKITKGTVEIINDVHLIKTGDKVGQSEATLLNLLKISPFTFGLALKVIYDHGQVFDPALLSVTPAEISKLTSDTIRRIAALSMALNIPTLASAPHWLAKSYKNAVAASLACDYTFTQMEQLKKMLDNPELMAAAHAAPAKSGGAPAKKQEAVKEEEEEEEMGLSLFD